MTGASPTLGALAADLAAAQGKLRDARKDSTNPHFRTRYADLASVWDACRAALSEHGLAVVQTPSLEDGRVIVTTTLLHKSGEWVAGSIGARPAKDDPQSIGSAITYLRRYGLAAIVGVAPGDDDDGEAAQGRTEPKGKPRAREEAPPPPPESHHPSWEADSARFCAYLGGRGLSYEAVADYLRDELGKPRPSAMAQEARDKLGAWLDKDENRNKIMAKEQK
jgi:hypothetical protein